jgi:hypothetical protein
MSDEQKETQVSNFSEKLTKDMSTEFSRLFADNRSADTTEFSNLTDSIKELSKGMNLSQKETDGMYNISEFVEHLNTCENDNCTMHQSVDNLSNNNYMKGFLLGAKFGKQKRS